MDSELQRINRNRDHFLAAKAAFNAGDLERCLAHYAPNHCLRSAGERTDRGAIAQLLQSFQEDWPGVMVDVEQTVGEGDWIAARSTAAAFHSVPFGGIAATGKAITASFWEMHRFNEAGEICESWNLIDSAAIQRQLFVAR